MEGWRERKNRGRERGEGRDGGNGKIEAGRQSGEKMERGRTRGRERPG